MTTHALPMSVTLRLTRNMFDFSDLSLLVVRTQMMTSRLPSIAMTTMRVSRMDHATISAVDLLPSLVEFPSWLAVVILIVGVVVE